ncbi:TPA: AHH domain-containing protein [Vibrio vulnificus]|nr:AHH domain-containing protein [Vibrio vulnificus]
MKHNLNIAGKKSNRPSKASAAELAFDRFDLLIADFYNKYRVSPPKGETAEQRAKRLYHEKRDYEFLKLKRRELIAHGQVRDLENKLQKYNDENLKKTTAQLLQERHHPTDRLSNNLTAAGEPKPTRSHEAHHIIPGKGQYRQADMEAARTNMHLHRIGINAPQNGVWLMNYAKNVGLNWESSESPAHRSLHTYNYETWISSKFSAAIPNKRLFESTLLQVKMHLKKGTYPKAILEGKNEDWRG